MNFKKGVAVAAFVLFTAFSGSHAALAAEDLNSVLSKLDAAAAKFHSTSADLEWSTTQTDPVPDTDVQKGIVYYERTGTSFRGGIHFATDNGQPAPKVVVCCTKGSIQLYEQLPNQVTTISKFSQYQDWFRLGFGASGKDLAAKWNIRYLGDETIDGIKTAKLEMTAKDPTIQKRVPKVTIWIDPDTAVSLKQIFDEGNGLSRTCIYTHIKVNQSLPKDAFTFPTDKQTRFTTQ